MKNVNSIKENIREENLLQQNPQLISNQLDSEPDAERIQQPVEDDFTSNSEASRSTPREAIGPTIRVNDLDGSSFLIRERDLAPALADGATITKLKRKQHPSRRGAKVRVRLPYGKELITIYEKHLSDALEDGVIWAGDGDLVAMTRPDGTKGEFDVKLLKPLLDSGYTLRDPGLLDHGKAILEGVAGGLGKLADTAIAATAGLASKTAGASWGGLASQGQIQKSKEVAADIAKDYWENPKIEKKAHQALDGGFSNNRSIQLAKEGGEFVGTLPAGAIAGKIIGAGTKLISKSGKVINNPIMKKINNFIGEASKVPLKGKAGAISVTSAFGAGVGTEIAREKAKHDNAVIRFSAEMLGGMLGGSIGASSLPMAKAAYDSVKAFRFKNIPDSLKATTLKMLGNGEVNLDSWDNLVKIGAGEHVTPELILQKNKAAAFLQSQRDIMDESALSKINEAVLDSVKKALDKHHIQTIASTTEDSAASLVSQEFTSSLDKIYKQVKKKKNELYKIANNYAENIIPKDEPILLNKSAKIATESLNELNLLKIDNIDWKKSAAQILTDVRDLKKIPNLTAQKVTKTLTDLNFMVENTPRKDLVYPYIRDSLHALGDDVSAHSSEYFKLWTQAKEYYRKEFLHIDKSSIIDDLLKGDLPKLAYEKVKTAQGIRELKHLMGRYKNGDDLVDLMVRARIENNVIAPCFSRELSKNKNSKEIHNLIFSPARFKKFFSEGEQEDYYKLLFGKSYNLIKKDIIPVSNAIKNTIKAMSNPSGSGNTIHYNNAMSALVGKTLEIGQAGLYGLVKVGGLVLSHFRFNQALGEMLLTPAVTKRLVAHAKRKEYKKIQNMIFKYDKGFFTNAGTKQTIYNKVGDGVKNTNIKDKIVETILHPTTGQMVDHLRQRPKTEKIKKLEENYSKERK